MNLIKAVSTGLFYFVWGTVAFTLLALVMVLAIMVDFAVTVIGKVRSRIKKNFD
jgi:heme exporter protein D